MSPNKLLTVADVAEIVSRPRQSVGRTLKRLHDRLVASGKPGILTTAPGWNGSKKQYLVSVGALQEHFPLWMKKSTYIPEAVQTLRDEVSALRVSMLGSFMALQDRVAALESGGVHQEPVAAERTETVGWPVPEGGGLYFVQICGQKMPIKIGRAKDFANRIYSLQTSCPWELVVLAVVPDGGHLENVIHRRFAEERIRGEWFTPSDRLLDFIKNISANLSELQVAVEAEAVH